MAKNGGIFRIALYFLAITGCFCIYSLIQERLMTVGFGPEEEVFEYSVFIVLVNRLVTCAVAAASLKVLGQSLAPSAPLLLFAIPSVANVVGSSAQYEALKYVSFPLQALSKCAKSVPVMAWSWITKTRKYMLSDYLSAATVTLGCVLFVLTGDITAPTTVQSSEAAGAAAAKYVASPLGPTISFTAIGLILLAIFMIFDGLTCTSQDKLFSSFDMHSCNQLLYTAGWSALLSGVFLAGSGQIYGAMSFVLRHPESLWLMLLQSVVSTTVQLFIVFTIKQYGALNFALMMTLRQFLSIVLSCLVFQHELSSAQWSGTVLVIAGLVGRSLGKSSTASRNGLDRTPSEKLKSKMPNTPRNGVRASVDGERTPLLVSNKDDSVLTMLTPKMVPSPFIPVIAGPPMPGHTLVSVLTSPLRKAGSLPSPLQSLTRAYPGSGDITKEKPG